MRVLQINDETTMLSSAVPIPIIGVLPVNAFLIRGAQPTLVDTGITPEHDEFIDALKELVDLKDLRWIALTHADRDHTGSISTLLAEAPNATVVTGFGTVGLMSVGADPIPPERALVVRDGSTVDLGDRTLSVHTPPLFDNPATLAFHDSRQDVLFSSDCFGAPFPTMEEALVEDVASIPDDVLEFAQLAWGSADSPWAHQVEPATFAARVTKFVEGKPGTVLSTHLPPIRGGLDRCVENLKRLPASEPLPMPDQADLEAFMAGMHQG